MNNGSDVAKIALPAPRVGSAVILHQDSRNGQRAVNIIVMRRRRVYE
jgi:hypothetical protein